MVPNQEDQPSTNTPLRVWVRSSSSLHHGEHSAALLLHAGACCYRSAATPPLSAFKAKLQAVCPTPLWPCDLCSTPASLHSSSYLADWQLSESEVMSCKRGTNLVPLVAEVTGPQFGSVVHLAGTHTGTRVRQETRSFMTSHWQESRSAYHRGLSTARQVARLHRTGSYWMGGRSGRSFKGVIRAATGTTMRVASSRLDGHTFQLKRTPSRSSFWAMYSGKVAMTILGVCHTDR